jgi:hypothetical protein
MTTRESCIEFRMGNPEAPNSPWGRDELDVFGDGRVAYRNQRGQVVRLATAQLTTEATDKLFAALAASPFPQWTNKKPLLPGTPLIDLTVKLPSGQTTVRLDYAAGLKTPGYALVIRMLTDWSDILRTQPAKRATSADLMQILDLPS